MARRKVPCCSPLLVRSQFSLPAEARYGLKDGYFIRYCSLDPTAPVPGTCFCLHDWLYLSAAAVLSGSCGSQKPWPVTEVKILPLWGAGMPAIWTDLRHGQKYGLATAQSCSISSWICVWMQQFKSWQGDKPSNSCFLTTTLFSSFYLLREGPLTRSYSRYRSFLQHELSEMPAVHKELFRCLWKARMWINNSKGKFGIGMGLMSGGQCKEVLMVDGLKCMFVKLIPVD